MINNRIKRLEQRMIPTGKFTVVWEDPDQEGVFYDKGQGEPDRKLITEEAIKTMSVPGAVILLVVYDRSKKAL